MSMCSVLAMLSHPPVLDLDALSLFTVETTARFLNNRSVFGNAGDTLTLHAEKRGEETNRPTGKDRFVNARALVANTIWEYLIADDGISVELKIQSLRAALSHLETAVTFVQKDIENNPAKPFRERFNAKACLDPDILMEMAQGYVDLALTLPTRAPPSQARSRKTAP